MNNKKRKKKLVKKCLHQSLSIPYHYAGSLGQCALQQSLIIRKKALNFLLRIVTVGPKQKKVALAFQGTSLKLRLVWPAAAQHCKGRLILSTAMAFSSCFGFVNVVLLLQVA